MPRGVPANPTKTIQCYECGRDIEVGTKTRMPKRCTECGIQASATALRELKGHYGPTWERYQAAMAQRFSSYSGGTPPPKMNDNA